MKQVSIYLESDCTAFRKHKESVAMSWNTSRKTETLRQGKTFGKQKVLITGRFCKPWQKRLGASGNHVPSASTARTLLSATCSQRNCRSGQTTILLQMES